MSFGVMGGAYQAFGHMQFLSRLLDYRLDIQQAVDMPRFFPVDNGWEVQMEESLRAVVQKDLGVIGHKIVPPPHPIGGAQAIWIDWEKGMLIGGSDPRKDGCVLGY